MRFLKWLFSLLFSKPLVSEPEPIDEPTPVPITEPTKPVWASDYILEMHQLHSDFRRAKGLEPQILDKELTEDSQVWAEWMSSHKFKHDVNVTENIAWSTGKPDAEVPIDMWIHSRGHRANLLSGVSTEKIHGSNTYREVEMMPEQVLCSSLAKVGFGRSVQGGRTYWVSRHGN